MSRVVWIQDLPIEVGGGAQNTDLSHVNFGRSLGYQILVVLPQTVTGFQWLPDDIVIVSNASAFKQDFFKDLIDKGHSLIFFLHDYWFHCSFRLFYPMQRKCKSCPNKPIWLLILQASKLIIWLSPLHRGAWLYAYPELKTHPYALVPSPIDPKQFYDMKQPREGVVSAAGLWPFKGRANVITWAKENPETPVDIYGGNPDNLQLPPNCKYIGDMPHSQMNEVFNKYKAHLWLPSTPQPFGRIVGESYLAGCDQITNRNVGAASYPWFKSREQVAKHCGNSSKLFWSKIKEVTC